ncbi:MAG: hypothetical protein HYW97_01225 [Candidatus Wildermuthbacteria bacterium]|nr:hypothetical protein [Candidatus Wildermuthbacteria bacterium]
MVTQLTRMDVAEVAERLQQFKGMPPEQIAFYLDLVASSRCNDEEANQLFDSFCKREADQEGMNAFFDHTQRCSSCLSAFLRLVWLSTDVDSH